MAKRAARGGMKGVAVTTDENGDRWIACPGCSQPVLGPIPRNVGVHAEKGAVISHEPCGTKFQMPEVPKVE